MRAPPALATPSRGARCVRFRHRVQLSVEKGKTTRMGVLMDARSQRDGRTRVAAVPVPTRAPARVTWAAMMFVAAAVVLLWTATPSRAGAGEAVWVHTWNAPTPGEVYVAKTEVRPGGGMYVAASLRRASGDLDIFVLRFTAGGTVDWVKHYDGPSHGVDLMTGLAVDGHGNVVVCGSSGTREGKEDWVVLKYGADGRRRWVRTLAGAIGGSDVPQAIAVDSGGNVIVAGSISRRTTGSDWCVAKLSPGGRWLWRTTMTRSAEGRDEALAVAVDPADAHIYVTGRLHAGGTGDDVVTVRYRADGRRVWRAGWNGDESGPDRGVALALSDGGVAVAGVSRSPASGDDALVLKYTRNGAFRWSRVVDGDRGAAGVDRFVTVGIDRHGNVVAGGGLTSVAGQGADPAVLRYVASGGPGGSWRLPGAVGDESVFDLAVTPDGASFAAGTSAGASADAFVAGLSHAVTPLWPPFVYDGAGADDVAQSVAVSSGAVYVAGVSGADLLIMKFAR